MNRLRAMVLSSLMIACAFFNAGAQEARLKGALDAETYAKVAKMTDSARAESLPVDPLIGVALEGASKHASSDRILGAVRGYLKALRGARAALGAEATPSEIESGAGALLLGVPADALQRIRAAGTRRPLTVPFVVLADLIARGVPKDTAVRAIEAAAHANARDDDYSALRRYVEADILAGASPAAAAMLRARGITGGPPE